MKTRILGLVAVGLLVGPMASQAAEITSFSGTTNDGVFTLSQAQANYLGTPTADRIGFFRVFSGGALSVTWMTGDFFDSDAVLATVISNGGAILGLFNGLGDGQLSYASGGLYSPFTSATFLSDSSFDGSLFRAIAFTYNSSAGNIVFRNNDNTGTATYGATARGPSDVPTVPEPGTLALLGLGLLGLGVARRKVA